MRRLFMVAFVCMLAEGNVYDFYFLDKKLIETSAKGFTAGLWIFVDSNIKRIIGVSSLLAQPYLNRPQTDPPLVLGTINGLRQYLSQLEPAGSIISKIGLLHQKLYYVSLYIDNFSHQMSCIKREQDNLIIEFDFGSNKQMSSITIKIPPIQSPTSKTSQQELYKKQIGLIYQEAQRHLISPTVSKSFLGFTCPDAICEKIPAQQIESVKRIEQSAHWLGYSLAYLFIDPDHFYEIVLLIYKAFAQTVSYNNLMAFAAG